MFHRNGVQSIPVFDESFKGNQTNTIQIQKHKRLRREIAMSEKEGRERMVRRTAEGITATAASTNQMRPLRTEIHINEFGSITASGNFHHRTCFQRKAPRGVLPPPSRRRRYKPMSIMMHNVESVMSVPITLGVVISKLSTTQVFAACDHVERICSCQVSWVRFKIIKIENSPLLHL